MEIVFNIFTEIGRIILLAFAIIVIVVMVKGSTLVLYDVTPFEHYVYIHKILHDKNGITVYHQDIDLVEPNIVDTEKMDSKRLDKLMQFPKSRLKPSAHIKIKDKAGTKKYEAYWHREQYKQNYQKATEKRGRGGIRKYVKEIPVTYQKNNTLHEGYLDITLIIPET